MVILKNIKRNETTMECDFYPEGDCEYGHMIVDLNSEEIIESSIPEEYDHGLNYKGHTRSALVELSQKEELPEKWIVMWY